MPDGPSTAVVNLSVLGLAFDLVGAFLLSIPMVWSSGEAVKFLQRVQSYLRKEFYDRIDNDDDKISKPTSNIKYPLQLFLFFILPPLYFSWFIFLFEPPSYISWWKREIINFFVGIPALISFFLTLILWIFPTIIRFISWVSDGNHDQRLGGLGLILLSIGFILQFIVNMQWVH